jgi:hypothetical protein
MDQCIQWEYKLQTSEYWMFEVRYLNGPVFRCFKMVPFRLGNQMVDNFGRHFVLALQKPVVHFVWYSNGRLSHAVWYSDPHFTFIYTLADSAKLSINFNTFKRWLLAYSLFELYTDG